MGWPHYLLKGKPMSKTLTKNDFVKIILKDDQVFIGMFVFEWENYFKITTPWWGDEPWAGIFNLKQIKKIEKLSPLQLLTNANLAIRNYIRENHFQNENNGNLFN